MSGRTPEDFIISYLKNRVRWHKDNGMPPMPYAMQAVLDHGRPFVGVGRPKGFRKRADRQCFYNAWSSAIRGGGEYVEGYALPNNDWGTPVHHAWITLDGVHAIDQTWRVPGQAYIGIQFPRKIASRYCIEGRYCKPAMEDDAAIRVLFAEEE